MAKMWAGRFSKEEDSLVNDFNSSISFDSRMYKHDIIGSIAHSKMLAKVKIINEQEQNAIEKGLLSILEDIESGVLAFDKNAEDIHMFVEAELTDRIGVAGKKLHTARSRNDQVALDIRMYLLDEITEIKNLTLNLIKALVDVSEENLYTVMSGYTHLQRAQPITFAHHLCAYAEMFKRDIERLEDCYKRTNSLPLGAGALASTTYKIDRFYTASLLNFKNVCPNSLDAVSDRDFCIELANTIALIMMHLSRLSEEIILWSSWEFKYIELDDAYATGSSIMPQKKNPDIAELVRGKTGRAIGNLTTLLSMMKSLPLAYNKDMQEDKEAIFDSVDTVKLCVKTFIPMLKTMRVLKDNMKKSAQKGFINATDCADYLVKKGLAFRDAYKITGQLVGYCVESNKVLEELSIDEFKQYSDVFDNDVYMAISLEQCLAERKVFGGPAPEAVLVHIKLLKEILN